MPPYTFLMNNDRPVCLPSVLVEFAAKPLFVAAVVADDVALPSPSTNQKLNKTFLFFLLRHFYRYLFLVQEVG